MNQDHAPTRPKWSWPPPSYSPSSAIERYLAGGGSISPRGRDGVIAELEDALCQRFDLPRAVLHGSGTMALYSAFFAVGLGPGDELICPTITFQATASPALHLGATVTLVDVDPETGCVDPAAILAAITSRTKAVVTNAQWGHPVDQESIRSICDRYHLAWIEDISHAHGATWNGRQVGTWGDVACASLGAEKILTGGMGGVLMSRHDDLIDRAVLVSHYLFRSRDDIRTPGFEALARTGYGLKLGIHPLAAVVVLDQLRNHFDAWTSQRSDSLMRLRDGLGLLPGVTPPVIRPEATSLGGWYGFKPWIDLDRLRITRPELVRLLREEGLEADEPGSPPLHRLPLFSEDAAAPGNWRKSVRHQGPFPAAERYSAGILSLPTFTGPEDEDALQATISGFTRVVSRLVQGA
jgi:dTDP-4-amino-4,6-dideoxygalactose transaminase